MTVGQIIREILAHAEVLRQKGLNPTAEELCRDHPELLEEVRRELAQDSSPETLPPQSGPESKELDTLAPKDCPPQGPTHPTQIGPYDILTVLGQGGMGVVYQARNRESGQLVAIKLLREANPHPELLTRFQREADILARLHHPNIVQLLLAGQHQGQPFLVMELVSGGSLDQKMRDGSATPVESARQIEALARAVHVAHQAGVIHRDLKPANVLLSEDGTLKVSDFGLAKLTESEHKQTSTGAVLGTPAYMSPEQASGQVRQTSPATDVWALGVILYEMLTCKLPFQGETALQTLQLVCSANPPSLRSINSAVPRDLETICLKCLHKNPARRYVSAVELADDLRRFLEAGPIRARRVGLLERAVKWRRRNRVTSALMLTTMLLLASAGAVWLWYWDAYQRVKVSYFANLAQRRVVMEGVGELSLAQTRGRAVNFKVYRRAGRVIQVDVVNGYGVLTDQHPWQAFLMKESHSRNPAARECRYVYDRDQKGHLIEVRGLDRNDNPVWVLRFTSATTAHYVRRNRATGPVSGGEGLPESRSRGGAMYLQFDFTDDGWERTVRYLDGQGKPVADDAGVYAMNRDFDERGLEIKRTYLSADDRPVLHKTERVAEMTREYDGLGNRLSEQYFGTDGKPCQCNYGFAVWRGEYDERGNLIGAEFFDVHGKACRCSQGHASWRGVTDDHGHVIEEKYFDLDGKLCAVKDGHAIYRAKFDGRGNQLEWSYFDVQDKPCLIKEGFSVQRNDYDERGNLVGAWFLDTKGKPCLQQDGVASYRAEYDDRGRRTAQFYFDLNEKPCLHKDGYAGWRARFDQRGNRVEETYFAVDGKPMLNKEWVAGWKARFDDRDDRIELTYLDTDGKPCLHKNGYATERTRYDKDGGVLERSYFGTDGKPCLHKDGYSICRYKGDDQLYYGVDGKPCLNKEGLGGLRFRFQDGIEMTYLGLDGKPCRGRQGYTTFRVAGEVMEYLDPDRKLCLGPYGFARVVTTNDSRGNAIERRYFGADGKPCVQANGFSRVTSRFDERNRNIAASYFGVDGKLCMTSYGYAKFTACFDDANRLIGESYFGADGKPCLYKEGYASWSCKFDERGNKVETRYFGINGKPCKSIHGSATWRSVFDARGNQIAVSHFGPDGKPCLHRNGMSRFTARFDERNRLVGESYFGVDGKPCLNWQGYASWSCLYDARGNKVETRVFGFDGKLMLGKEGYARKTMRYDEQGNLIYQEYFDPEGKALKPRVVITRVVNGSQAARLGLRVGDQLIRYAGEPVQGTHSFIARRNKEKPGEEVKVLVVIRDGKEITVQVSPGPFGVVLKDDLTPK